MVHRSEDPEKRSGQGSAVDRNLFKPYAMVRYGLKLTAITEMFSLTFFRSTLSFIVKIFKFYMKLHMPSLTACILLQLFEYFFSYGVATKIAVE